MNDSTQPLAPQRSVRQVVIQMLVLMLVSILCGAFANTFGPKRIPWQQAWSGQVGSQAEALGIRTATVDDAKRILDEGIHFIFDARPPVDFETGHIPGAMLLYSEEFDTYFPDYAMMLTPEQPVMVYCSGYACDESLLVSEMLFEQGFTNLVLFAGGMAEWNEAGYATERGL